MRVHLTVQGFVQGIGYRYFVIETAQTLNLTGWVRNCSNGDVECEVQGVGNQVNQFLESLEKGHTSAQVNSIIKEDLPEKLMERSFEIHI